MLVAAHNSKKVHPECVQGAGVGRRMEFVADLLNTNTCEMLASR